METGVHTSVTFEVIRDQLKFVFSYKVIHLCKKTMKRNKTMHLAGSSSEKTQLKGRKPPDEAE